MRVTKEMVVKTASDIVDETGLNKVTLKLVAEALGIQSPSLYNHVESLGNLLREIAHRGMNEMNTKMRAESEGKTGEEAFQAVGLVYFDFMMEHYGVYETIQWSIWHGNEETEHHFGCYKSLVRTMIGACDFKEEYTEEILKLYMGMVHGYSIMEIGKERKKTERARTGLSEAINTLFLGICQKYQ